jgi:hypothetical protein
MLTCIACTGNQEHCFNSDSLGQEVLTQPLPLSPAPCLLCGGRCCPQNELFPYVCVAPGICTPIYPTHYCQGHRCPPSVPCDTTGLGCCPNERICSHGETCCPPNTDFTSYLCLGTICYETVTAHSCGSTVCPLHIPCDTTGLGCCLNERICGHGETCCPPNNATFNYECDPDSQSCIAIKRCNDGDNPCRGSTCMDDGYCCPDSLSCNKTCCLPPQVPPAPPTWECANKTKSLCCPAGDIAADDGKCCSVEQVLELRNPTRIVCCVLPEKPYNGICCTQNRSCGAEQLLLGAARDGKEVFQLEA